MTRPEHDAARLLVHWGVTLTRLLGIAGVADHESRVAKRWAFRLELPLLFIALWIPVEWYLVHTGHLSVSEGFGIDVILWGFFLVEQLVLLALGGSIMPMLDPETFDGFGDGMWWTLVTLSTVGYGDLVPQTESGRLMGLIFVAMAVIWLSLISASIAAFLVGLRMEASTEDEERIDTQILHRLDRIEALLDQEREARQNELGREEGGDSTPGR